MDSSDGASATSARQKRQERLMEEGMAKPGVAEALRVYGNVKRSKVRGTPRRSFGSGLAASADVERTT